MQRMKNPLLLAFCLSSVSLPAQEQRFMLLASAATVSLHDNNAFLNTYTKTDNSGGMNINQFSLQTDDLTYPDDNTFLAGKAPLQEEETKDLVHAPEQAGIEDEKEGGRPEQDLSYFPNHRKSEEEQDSVHAINAELQAMHAEEREAYLKQVKEEGRARQRLKRASLIAGFVFVVCFITLSLSGDSLVGRMREEPGIRLVDAIPPGFKGLLTRSGGLISAFGPMMSLYLVFCLIRWKRHNKILRKLERKIAMSTLINAQIEETHSETAGTPSGSNPH